ncbi:MAG: M50 family metallopeptidase [Dehalococcoidia bacterium]
MTKPALDRWAVSIHEAGHCLMAAATGLEVEEVRLSADGGGQTKVKAPDLNSFRESLRGYGGASLPSDMSAPEEWRRNESVRTSLSHDPVLDMLVDVRVAGVAAVEACYQIRFSLRDRLTLPREMLSCQWQPAVVGMDKDLDDILRLFDVRLVDIRQLVSSVSRAQPPWFPSLIDLAPGYTSIDSFINRVSRWGARWLLGDPLLEADLLLKSPEQRKLDFEHARKAERLRGHKDYLIYEAVFHEVWRRTGSIGKRFGQRRAKATLIELARNLALEGLLSGSEVRGIIEDASSKTRFKWNVLAYRT